MSPRLPLIRRSTRVGARFFWPAFSVVGWGIIVLLNAWDVYWRPTIAAVAVRHYAS